MLQAIFYTFDSFTSIMINSNSLEHAMNYQAYLTLMESLVAEGKTSGSNPSERYIGFTKLNLLRMRRLDKTIKLLPELIYEFSKLKSEFVCLVLTESWCGDVAQNIPIFHSIEKICQKIKFRFLLRDQHLEIMDQHLTNGGRSIPKLICFEQQSKEVLFTWGPRPAELQEIVYLLIKEKVSSDKKGLTIQTWYNTDKTMSCQKELLLLIRQYLSA